MVFIEQGKALPVIVLMAQVSSLFIKKVRFSGKGRIAVAFFCLFQDGEALVPRGIGPFFNRQEGLFFPVFQKDGYLFFPGKGALFECQGYFIVMVPVSPQGSRITVPGIIKAPEDKGGAPIYLQVLFVIDEVAGAKIYRVLTEYGADLLRPFYVGKDFIQGGFHAFKGLFPLGLPGL